MRKLLQLSDLTAKLLLAAALSCGLLLPRVVYGQATERVIEVDLAVQPLESALRALADKNGMQILFNPNDLRGLTAPAIKGKYTTTQILEKMVAGTGLTAVHDGKNAIAIKPKERERRSNAADPPVSMPQIMVQGARELNMDLPRSRDDAQPYVIFSRETIENSGATSVEEFLKQRLTMNTLGSLNAQTNSSSNASQFNLRGLGAANTLVLIDGHRAANGLVSGQTPQADLNGIPLAAIERIEVLPTTASGIYGGGATGGVINIVLRRDYSGIDLKITYGNTFDSDVALRNLNIGAGFNLEGGKTNILIAASYSDGNSLSMQDRDFTQRGYAAILANNPSFIFSAANPPLGATTNIRSLNGSNLVLRNGTSLGSPLTFVPIGYAGTAADGGMALVANAGRYNLDLANSAQFNGGGRQTIFTASTVESIMTTVRRQFMPSLQAFLELSASNNTGRRLGNSLASSYTVAANAPNNPFGQAIRVTTPLSAGDNLNTTAIYDRRAVAGIISKLPMGWNAEADFTWNRTRSFFSALQSPGTDALAIANGTLDVLRDTNVYPLDYSAHPLAHNFQGPLYATLKDAALRVAGPIGDLPGGAPQISALLEYREEFAAQGETANFIFPSRSQAVSSAYLESRIPIISAKNRRSGVEELELQIAGRWDRYAVDGATTFISRTAPAPVVRIKNVQGSTNPTVGLRYRPVSDLFVRASYGTGFLPPSVNQLNAGAPFIISTAILDPRRGNQPTTGVSSINGGNPALQPEESESWSTGLVWTPTILRGLRLSVDYTRIHKTDNISALTAQGVVDNEDLLPGRVTRGPPTPGDSFGIGPITFIDNTLVNVSDAKVEAIDVALDYRKDTATLGSFEFLAAATWQLHYKTQLIATAPVIENVGVTSTFLSNPSKLKANLGVTWRYDRFTLGWTASYFAPYRLTNATQILNQGSSRIPSQNYHDVFGSYRFPDDAPQSSASGRMLSGVVLRAGIKNIFNRKPPLDLSNPFGYYYSFYGDPRLATYYVAIEKQL